MTKVVKTSIITILILTIFLSSVYAIAGVDLSYWYSSANEIYYWTNNSHQFFVHPYESSLSLDQMINSTSLAYSRWNTTTGISGSRTTTQSNAHVDVLGFTRASFTSMGLPTSVIGIGFEDGKTLVAEGYYGLDTNNIYKVTGKGYLYFVWDSNTSNFSSTQWNNLFVHEMGHIFGYIGHYESNGVMKANFNDITTTYHSTNNKNHLKQVY